MKRETYTLTPDEIKEFKRLPLDYGHAFEFWQKVAYTRGLDHKTIIGSIPTTDNNFSALTLGHGKHWCYPVSIKCASPPKQ